MATTVTGLFLGGANVYKGRKSEIVRFLDVC